MRLEHNRIEQKLQVQRDAVKSMLVLYKHFIHIQQVHCQLVKAPDSQACGILTTHVYTLKHFKVTESRTMTDGIDRLGKSD